jgi:hypothetical protein
MTSETTQTPPTATAAKPGQPGYKPSRETLKKMQEGRRRKEEEKKQKAARDAAARSGAQGRAPAAPTPAAVPEKMRKKIAEMIVAPTLGLAAATGFFVARRVTAPAVPMKEDGTGPAVTELEYAGMVQAWREGETRAFKDDELEKWERDWIADELTTELVRYPRVRALLLQLVAIAERGGLAQAVSVVIAWRMIRHEMIPADFLELAREAVTEMRDNARKARGVKDEVAAAGNGASADDGASPHFTERVA